MLKVFEPRYVPPDRTTITCHFMPDLYRAVEEEVTSSMSSGMEYYAITTDAWTSRANHSYVTLTVHYINGKWELCYHVLSTAEFSVDHTAVNLANGIEECLSRWNLSPEYISAIVTDNAANIVASVRSLEFQHLGCFNHTLQLVVQKAVNSSEMATALGRARRLVRHFHQSVKSTQTLRQKQKDLKHAENKLIQVITMPCTYSTISFTHSLIHNYTHPPYTHSHTQLHTCTHKRNSYWLCLLGLCDEVEFDILYDRENNTTATAHLCHSASNEENGSNANRCRNHNDGDIFGSNEAISTYY